MYADERIDVVGLFGTCGDSTWREDIAIPSLEKAGIRYFNPVVEDWTPECQAEEARHAATDKVILMVITGETTATGSLAEAGWIALQAHLRDQRLVIVIEDMPQDVGRANKVRALVREHMKSLPVRLYQNGTISVCSSVEDAVERAIELMQ